MSEIITSFTLKVETLEKKFETFEKGSSESAETFKEEILELLAALKHHQDEPENEDLEDDFEDLIYRVILILGQV